jgi:hypothetical protein
MPASPGHEGNRVLSAARIADRPLGQASALDPAGESVRVDRGT